MQRDYELRRIGFLFQVVPNLNTMKNQKTYNLIAFQIYFTSFVIVLPTMTCSYLNLNSTGPHFIGS